jgi:hypothetical protein
MVEWKQHALTYHMVHHTIRANYLQAMRAKHCKELFIGYSPFHTLFCLNLAKAVKDLAGLVYYNYVNLGALTPVL